MSGGDTGEEVRRALEEATVFRALSLLFSPPDDGKAAEIRQLVDAARSPLCPPIAALAVRIGVSLSNEHIQILGPGGPCPTGESDYVANELGAKGGLLGDVAAFYRAFSFDPTRERQESPDHVCSELSFVAWMHLKEAFALQSGHSEEAAICREARRTFEREHLLPLLAGIGELLKRNGGSSPYAALGDIVLATFNEYAGTAA